MNAVILISNIYTAFQHNYGQENLMRKRANHHVIHYSQMCMWKLCICTRKALLWCLEIKHTYLSFYTFEFLLGNWTKR